MVQKEKCIKALEDKIKVFSVIDSKEAEERFYHGCCAIVWFLEKIGVFEEEEGLIWIDKFADASANAWIRLELEEEG